jgi:hypothetical protein
MEDSFIVDGISILEGLITEEDELHDSEDIWNRRVASVNTDSNPVSIDSSDSSVSRGSMELDFIFEDVPENEGEELMEEGEDEEEIEDVEEAMEEGDTDSNCSKKLKKSKYIMSSTLLGVQDTVRTIKFVDSHGRLDAPWLAHENELNIILRRVRERIQLLNTENVNIYSSILPPPHHYYYYYYY